MLNNVKDVVESADEQDQEHTLVVSVNICFFLFNYA